VVARAGWTPWYDGPTIADAIETIRRVPLPVERAFRLDVQDVYRRGTERVLVGTVASGAIEAGADVVLLPAGVRVRAERLVRWPDAETPVAWAGESIGIVLDGDRFAGRGDTLAAWTLPPRAAERIALETFWLAADGPVPGERLRLKRGTQSVAVVIDGPASVYDIESAGESGPSGDAQYNIVRLAVCAASPVVFDRRADDPAGARMVLLRGERVIAVGFATDALEAPASAGDRGDVTAAERERRAGHRAAIVWLTGLSGAGKTTIARAVERRLFERGDTVAVVDGDALRATLNADLGFGDGDRGESVRRATAVAEAVGLTGAIVLVAHIAPFAADRAAARASARLPFYEVFVDAPLETCERRDPKGLYRRARGGELTAFTGIDSRYEAPAAPDVVLPTGSVTLEHAVDVLVAFIDERTRARPADQNAVAARA
jgi:bifunctional enzyme CysN/CysC